MDKRTVRPTKKQRETLAYIEEFIAKNGYSPSYREIMRDMNYNSVATVSLHVNNLIARGHLQKRGNSARSLELTATAKDSMLKINQVKPSEEKWLIDKIDYFITNLESQNSVEQNKIDEVYVLIAALRVLGIEGAAQAFIPRLSQMKKKSIK